MTDVADDANMEADATDGYGIGDDLASLRGTNEQIATGITLLINRVELAEDVAKKAEAAQIAATKALTRWRRVGIGILISIALDVALTGIGGVVVVQLREVLHRTSSQAFCPLYSLFLSSLNPDMNHDGTVTSDEQSTWESQVIDSNHDGTVTASERSNFAKAKRTVLQGNKALNC